VIRLALAALALAVASPAAAQGVVGSPVDVSALATKAEMQAAQAAALAAIPAPASTVGSGEMVGGAVGVSLSYKRADWVPPRQSRTGACTLNASNVCTIAWTSAFAAAPVMLGDPVAINTVGSQPISCNVTAAPTTTGVPVKCWAAQNTILSLSVVTAGLTLTPFNATTLTGTTVTAAAIPASQ
jgi:hypothetical protein